MHKLLLLVTFVVLNNTIIAQKTTVKPKAVAKPKPAKVTSKKTEVICNDADKDAEYPDGASAWQEFLRKNINPFLPKDNNAPNGLYKVVVRFTIEPNGTLSNIAAITKHGYGMEEELIRVVKKSQTWYPAYKNCLKTDFTRDAVINFNVSKEN